MVYRGAKLKPIASQNKMDEWREREGNEFRELSSRDLTHNQMGIRTIADNGIMANNVDNNDEFSF